MKKLTIGLLFTVTCLFVQTALLVAADSDDFVITVKTDNPGTSSNTQFTIPTKYGGYNYNVDIDNDGVNDATGVTGDYTCNYPSAGTYTIRHPYFPPKCDQITTLCDIPPTQRPHLFPIAR